MKKNKDFSSSSHCKHHLRCRLIFVCKYRKKLLIGQVRDDIKQIIQSISYKSDFKIETMETDVDHIHFLIRYIPRLSVCSIVRRIKQESTKRVWIKHEQTLLRHFWKEKTFWSDGYFVCSIGNASPETIKNYILSQG